MDEKELRYTETFTTWNKLAKIYQEKFMDLDLYNESYDRFCDLVTTENASILEIGCGPGNITKYLLNKRPDFKIEGADVSPAMIELAKQNNPSAYFTTFDCRDLDKIKAKFDAIVCGFCIPYLSPQDCSKLVTDCSTLMNEGAILYLSFVEGDSNKSGYQSGSTSDRTYFYFHDLKNLKEDFQKNQLNILTTEIKKYKRSEGIYEEHTILILRK